MDKHPHLKVKSVMNQTIPKKPNNSMDPANARQRCIFVLIHYYFTIF